MTTSSGQLITTRESHRACQRCDFEGFVEIVDDPETLQSWWACANCGNDYLGEIGE